MTLERVTERMNETALIQPFWSFGTNKPNYQIKNKNIYFMTCKTKFESSQELIQLYLKSHQDTLWKKTTKS